MTRTILPLTLLLLACVCAMTPAQGCIGDDGFNQPCCTPVVNPNLPTFPSFQQDGRFGCIFNCALEADFNVMVTTAHTQILCDYAIISVIVTPNGPGAPGWTGTLFAKYARTWVEPTLPGLPDRQVWRFLVNGRMNPTAGAIPCPLPPHPNNGSHFQGHIDYSCDQTALGLIFRMALSLSHLEGCISHHALSAQPLPAALSHPDRSYHLVTPGASFSFVPVPQPAGAVPAEAVRSASLFPVYTCLGEGNLAPGVLQNVGPNCPCLPAFGPYAWENQLLSGSTACVGALWPFASIPLPPVLPPIPTGFGSKPIGRWAGPPGIFPGTRDLVLHWGVLQYADPCNPNAFPFHAVGGVSTIGPPGVTFSSAAGVAHTVFMDLGNKLLPNGLFGPLSLGWGGLYFSQVVWNLNLP